MRTRLFAGNWKLNKSNHEAAEFVRAFRERAAELGDREIVICPSHVSVVTAADIARGSNIKIGAQDLSFREEGAYTGEVSARMLKDFCEYCIIGHSERRRYHSERNEIVNRKVLAALKHGIKPIICIGEDRDQRRTRQTEDVLHEQLASGLEDVSRDDIMKTVIAYEPVWAISGGDPLHEAATAEEAEQAHGYIRGILAKLYGDEVSGQLRVIYGGSVKPGNIAALMERPNIDGALVGTASLDIEQFLQIIRH